MTEFDDIYYIRLVRNGNTNAFGHIVQRYQRMVYTTVAKIVETREEAEDITQEVFIKVFQSLDKFRAESGFSTWLYRIAYNTTITAVRKQRANYISLDDITQKYPDDELSDEIDSFNTEEQLHYLDTVLKMLPPEDAQIITLYYLNNSSVNEISGISGLSSSNVKVKLHRIRKFMNFELNKLIDK